MSERHSPAKESREIKIPVGALTLTADLALPEKGKGMVLFAHGSGSSRLSPRNRYVSRVLQEGCIGTLLLDLLTVEEEEEDRMSGCHRFNIDLLTERLIMATDWLRRQPAGAGSKLGYFGASTGAAAALRAAAERKEEIHAVVSRGGRPDLAENALAHVRAPTLLIVGGQDDTVIELNEQALTHIGAKEKKIVVIPGASHLFEEPGKLEKAAHLALNWFKRHLTGGSVPEAE